MIRLPLHSACSTRIARSLALAWLLLALLVAPTVGRLHQVAHGGGLDRAHAGHALAKATPSPSAAGAGLLPLLLGQHAPADCLLLDQLALGDALHGATPALPAPLPARAVPAHTARPWAAGRATPFQARGPPLAA